MQIAGSHHIGPYTTEELKDVIMYIVDIAATLWYFIDAAPEAAPVLMASEISTR